MTPLDQQLQALRQERDRLSGQIQAVRAALSCEAGQDAESVARRLYHERLDFKFACEGWQRKAEALQGRMDQIVALGKLV